MGWDRPAASKISVYVDDLVERFALVDENAPFTSADLQGNPFIGLPCRVSEPTIDGARLRATADATHEAVHVVNAVYRPFRSAHSVPWRWFNEGTAVFGERFVLPNNRDNLRFAMDWCDRPDVPLDSDFACYQAGLFIHYLCHRLGTEFLARVWKESSLTDTPVEVVDRLVQSMGSRFASTDPGTDDVFGVGYSIDSYCPWDNDATGFADDAFARYGTRAVTESFEMRAGDSVRLSSDRDVLDHLAIRYYRFFIQDSVHGLRVSLTSFPADGQNRFKATLVTINCDWGRGPSARLVPMAANSDATSPTTLETTLSIEEEHAVEYIVLVVANCGVRGRYNSVDTAHDDDQEYRIEAEAV